MHTVRVIGVKDKHTRCASQFANSHGCHKMAGCFSKNHVIPPAWFGHGQTRMHHAPSCALRKPIGTFACLALDRPECITRPHSHCASQFSFSRPSSSLLKSLVSIALRPCSTTGFIASGGER